MPTTSSGARAPHPGPSIQGPLGSDIIDWRPRGAYAPGAGCTTNPWRATVGNQTIDPCDWFVMTNTHDDMAGDFASTVNNQHHEDIDWQYGGWDRDVMQADVAANGPNDGDRLLDWTGAYNLCTSCNAAYGGFNDVRQWSPDMQSFLEQWAWALGAGQQAGDVTTSNTSAYDELALVYQADNRAHGSGPAFPTTPGHFDDPGACSLQGRGRPGAKPAPGWNGRACLRRWPRRWGRRPDWRGQDPRPPRSAGSRSPTRSSRIPIMVCDLGS